LRSGLFILTGAHMFGERGNGFEMPGQANNEGIEAETSSAPRQELEKTERIAMDEVKSIVKALRSAEAFAKKRESGMSASEAEAATAQEVIAALLREKDRFRHVVRTAPQWEDIKDLAGNLRPATIEYEQSQWRQGSYYFQTDDGQGVRIKALGEEVGDGATTPSPHGVSDFRSIKFISRADHQRYIDTVLRPAFTANVPGDDHFRYKESGLDAPEVGGSLYDSPTDDPKRAGELRDSSVFDFAKVRGMHRATRISEVIK